LNYRSAILFVRKAKTSCFVPRNITLYLVEQIGIRSSFFLMTIHSCTCTFLWNALDVLYKYIITNRYELD